MPSIGPNNGSNGANDKRKSSNGPNDSNDSQAVSLPSAPHTYTKAELQVLEKKNNQHVTRRHLFYALEHVAAMLRKRWIRYGVMGGMGIILLGNDDRTTKGVDIIVDVGPTRLLDEFRRDDRVYRPDTVEVERRGVARLFVLMGGVPEKPVRLLAKVDLIRPGYIGTPSSLEGKTSAVSLETEFGPRRWYTLSLPRLFKSKLRAFHMREGKKDLRDLVGLCCNCTAEVRGPAPVEDESLRAFFYLAYKQTQPPAEKLKFIYDVLGQPRLPSSSSSGIQGSAGSNWVSSRR